MDFALDRTDVPLLEARVAIASGHGLDALDDIVVEQDAILQRSLDRTGRHLDQVLWAMLQDERRSARTIWGPSAH
jgi:hypothetical protein